MTVENETNGDIVEMILKDTKEKKGFKHRNIRFQVHI